jgi:RHS repeat-associated protein
MVSSATTYYLYDDDSTSPVCEMNSSGTITATNTYGLAGLISRHTASGSTFYEFDPQGTVVQRLNSAGSNTVTSTADAFGNIANSGTVSDPFGYEAESGYYTDQSTGLLLSTYRYYDPQSGRYLNRDPISYSGGMNVYGYCGNESVVYTDSLGTDPTIRNKLPVGQPGGIEYAPPCYGCAPRDGDGRPINLHHVGQKNDGEVDELPWGAHMGNGNNQLNHTPGQQSEIDRGKFNNWRKKYWKKEADSGRFANLPKWVAPTPSKFNQWISGVSNGQYVEGAFLIPSAIATLGWVALPLAAGAGATATTSGTCALAF